MIRRFFVFLVLVFFVFTVPFWGISQNKTEKVYHNDSVDTKASYAGGTSKLNEYIVKNLIYPKDAEIKGIEGVVIVQFTVEKDGSISNIRIKKGIGFGCDGEAIRLIKQMPKWKPATKNGANVRTKCYYKITFTLKLKDNKK